MEAFWINVQTHLLDYKVMHLRDTVETYASLCTEVVKISSAA